MKLRSWNRQILAVVFALLALSVAVVTAGAQGGKGAISGRVTDGGGGVLQGARIEVAPAGVTAAADLQGQFLINGLNAGSYTVTVSYVGFKTFTKEVTVGGAQPANVDAKLEVESQNLEVLVTAERVSGEAEEINRQVTADNVVQVLSSDVIRSLPNANLADALGRLPSVTLERDEGEGKYVQVRGTEPRLTNATIDGINIPSPENGVRQIKFDAIPADIVESVEINKTLQANMDADGIGGSVNLVTKTAGERPTVSLSGVGGYTPILGGRSVVQTTGTVGQRFGASKRLGALIGYSYDWSGRGIDDTEPTPDILTTGTGSQAQFIDSADLREYRYNRTRWGAAGSADYKPSDGSTLYIHGFYSDFKNYGDRWVYTLNDNSTSLQSQLLNGSGGNPRFNTSIRRPDYAISNLVAGGKHVLTTTWFTWDVSASRSRQLERGDPQASFRVNDHFNTQFPGGSTCMFDPTGTNQFRPKWTQQCFTEAYDPTNLSLNNLDLFGHGLTAQVNLQITGAAAKRYHIGSRLATIEIGGRFRNAHKFDNSFTTNFAFSGAQAPTLAMFLNDFKNDNYYGGTYPFGPAADYKKVLAFYNANQSQFTLRRGQIGPGYNTNNYDLVEQVGAGYLMNTIDLTNRLRLVVGVRFENTNLSTTDPTFDSNNNFVQLFTVDGSYLKVLPSASLRIGVDKDTDVRLVYSRGLGRPNPTDIAQAASFTTGGAKNTLSLGNPNLKAETANNYDILIERSLRPFGQISAGFFYKDLSDPIVNKTFVQTFSPNGPVPQAPPGVYQVTQTVNIGSAWVSGFEAAYVQHLSFLPGLWSGLGISANYGYTASEASGLFDRLDHPRLVRSAPHTWNVSPTYDKGRFSIRVGLSYNAANIFAYQFTDGSDPSAGDFGTGGTPGGRKGPNGDQYLYAHLQVDAQGSVRLTHGFSFVMYGLNLTNEVFGFYNGSKQFLVQREYYTPEIAAGFRWSPSFEHK